VRRFFNGEIALGFAAGIVFCLAGGVFLSIGGWRAPTDSTGLEFWIDRYQGGLAGLLALVGAGLTVWAIFRQIKAASDLASDAREREHRAARSVLAMALASLLNYCKQCLKYLDTVRAFTGPEAIGHMRPVGPDVPGSTLDPLLSCLRYATSDRAGQISNLLIALQIQNARVRDIAPSATPHEISARMLDTVELEVRVNALFAYARGDDSPMSPDVDSTQISTAILMHELNYDIEGARDLHDLRVASAKRKK
jgi:hypothetical protein